MAEIEVKALIDKKMNKVIFVESNADLVDMLFSFLIRPMGNIIKLTRNQTSTEMIGSINNLYNSVESLDIKFFKSSVSRSMLLCPRNGDEARIKIIRPLEDNHVYDYFFCNSKICLTNKDSYLLSYYKDVCHFCGQNMVCADTVYDPSLKDENGGVFVKGLTRYLITDGLQIVPLPTVASFSLLSNQDDVGDDANEERTFGIGVNEILNLLNSSLVSSFPLTETLLNYSTVKRSFQEYKDQIQGIAIKQEREMCVSGRDENKNTQPDEKRKHKNIRVKLLLEYPCQQNEVVVCYAEAEEDFINLLLSFLTVPLGIIVKEMRDCSSKGCSSHLYKSVPSLDATAHLMSDEIKQFLLYPKIAPHFGFKNQLLSVEEIVTIFNYTAKERYKSNPSLMIATDESPNAEIKELRLLDPRSSSNEEMKSKGGYVKGPAMFTVTDCLVIAPISPLSGFTILKKLNVPYSDIEERIVHVGKEEAACLLVASLISESPLTDVFLRKVPKQER